MLSPQIDANKYTYIFIHVYSLDSFKHTAEYSRVRSNEKGFTKAALAEIAALHPREYIVASFSPLPMNPEAARASFETYRKERMK